MGTERDRQIANAYSINVIDPISTYEGSGLARKIVDIFGEAGTREWRSWQGNNDEIGKLDATEARLGVSAKVEQAYHFARLLGGGAILIGDGAADPSKPLEPGSVGLGGIKYLTVLTRYELIAGPVEQDPHSEYYGRPQHYMLNAQPTQPIHPSRLVIFRGPRRATRVRLGQMDTWGVPVLESVWTQLTSCDSGMANAVGLLFEANVDVFSLPEYAERFEDEGETYRSQVNARIAMAALQKSNLKALVLDAQEKYTRNSISFTGIPDIIDRAQQFLAGVTGIAVSELFGRQAGGMNNEGASEKRTWYDTVRAMQRNVWAPAMQILDECLIHDALGKRPDGTFYTWTPLWQPTAEERAKLGRETADTLKVLRDTGVFPSEALAIAGAAAMTESGAMPGLEDAVDKYGGPEAAAEEEEDRSRAAQDAARRTQTGEDEPTATRRAKTRLADGLERSLYIMRRVSNAEEILAHYAGQGVPNLVDAADLHITVAASRKPVDWIRALGVGNAQPWEWLPGSDARTNELLGPSNDTLTLHVPDAEGVIARHKALEQIGASWDFPSFVPHITIAKGYQPGAVPVVPYPGPIDFGPEEVREFND